MQPILAISLTIILAGSMARAADVDTISGSGVRGVGNGNSNTAQFYEVYAVAALSNGDTIVAEYTHNCLRRVKPDGSVEAFSGACSTSSGYVDSTVAASVRYFRPSQLAVDASDNIYVLDRGNNCIRKVDGTTGAATTFSGSCGADAAYANGHAKDARYHTAWGMTIDSHGNVYVGDRNNVIRKITPAGVASLFAGSPGGSDFTYIYDMVWAGGYLYVADTGAKNMKKVSVSGVITDFCFTGGNTYTDGPCASAQMPYIGRMVVDAATNDIYFTDGNSHTIRKVTLAGVVSTVSGTPGVAVTADGTFSSAAFNYPYGMDISHSGDLLVLDASGYKLRVLRLGLTRVSSPPAAQFPLVDTLSGSGVRGVVNGDKRSAQFYESYDIVVLPNSHIIVAEYSHNCLRKVLPDGTVIPFSGTCTTSLGFADSDVQQLVKYARPAGLVLSSTALYVNDRGNNCIRKVDINTGAARTFSGLCGDNNDYANGPGTQARYYNAWGMTIDSHGNLYIGDRNNVIRKITPDGVASLFAGTPGGSDFTYIYAMVWIGDTLYVADTGAKNMKKVSLDGTISHFCFTGGSALQDGDCSIAQMPYIGRMVADAQGDMYVTDGNSDVIRKITQAGQVTTVVGSSIRGYVEGSSEVAQLTYPYAIDIDLHGYLVFMDTSGYRLRRADLYLTHRPWSGGTQFPTTSVLTGSGTRGIQNGDHYQTQFYEVYGLQALPNGDIIVAEYTHHCLRRIKPDGSVEAFSGACSTTAGFVDSPVGANVRYNRPSDLVLDSNNNLFVKDRTNNCIRKVDINTGGATTFSGKCGEPNGYANGAGEAARYHTAWGMTIDANDNVYIGDRNNVIRKITPGGVASLFAGTPSGSDFTYIYGLAWIGNTLYVADTGAKNMKKVTTTGVISHFCFTGGSGYVDGPCATAQMPYIGRLRVDSDNNLLLTDSNSRTIRKIDVTTETVSTVVASGQVGLLGGTTEVSQLTYPYGFGFNADKSKLFIASGSGAAVLQVDTPIVGVNVAPPAAPTGPLDRPAPPGTPTLPPLPTAPPTPSPEACVGSCLWNKCPEGVTATVHITGAVDTALWGTSWYTDDSSVPAAAVHAGVIGVGQTSSVTVVCGGAQAAFAASLKNGVQSQAFGSWPKSFSFQGDASVTEPPGVTPQPPTLPPAPEVCSLATCLHNQCTIQGATKTLTVTGKVGGSVWGTDIYTDDSDVGTSATHFGALEAGQTGPVTFICTGSQVSFAGTTRNGVTTNNYGAWQYSFTIDGNTPPPPPPPPQDFCTTCLNGKCSTAGTTFTVTVLGKSGERIWGEDTYTDDSQVGTAAVHAGLVQIGETATLTATCQGPQSSFAGTIRNQISSIAYGQYGGSYSLSTGGSPPPSVCVGACIHNKCAVIGSTKQIIVTGATSGSGWGVDQYTDDTNVQLAAVHMGLVAAGETATLVLRCSGPQASWSGSTRNGATTEEYANHWPYSFTLSPAP